MTESTNYDERFVVIDFERLSEINPEQAEEYDYGWDRDYKSFLWDNQWEEVVFVDGGEPEDFTLDRRLKPLVDLLNKVNRDE
jgi:hypothetical protein